MLGVTTTVRAAGALGLLFLALCVLPPASLSIQRTTHAHGRHHPREDQMSQKSLQSWRPAWELRPQVSAHWCGYKGPPSPLPCPDACPPLSHWRFVACTKSLLQVLLLGEPMPWQPLGWLINNHWVLSLSDQVPRPLWRAGWQPPAVILCNPHLPPIPLALSSRPFWIPTSPYYWEFKV